MEGQLVHFELPAQDAGRAREFWKSLFGWKFRTWDGPVEYHMLEGNEPGGAIYPDADAAGSGPVVYFGTSNISASVTKVRELGGAAEEEQPIPGIGWFSRCVDTEGNPFSLFQADESAPARDES